MTPSIDELDDHFWPMVGDVEFAPGVRIPREAWESLSDLDRSLILQELAGAGRAVHDGRLTTGALWHEPDPGADGGMALIIPEIRHSDVVTLKVDSDDVAEALRIAREWAADFLEATAGSVPVTADRLTSGD